MSANLWMHYAIPSEGLSELAQVGQAHIALFAFRCSECQTDFHIDRKPIFCPGCGELFERESPFGQRRN